MNLSAYREDACKQMDGAPVYIDDAIFYVRRWGTPESNAVKRRLERELWGPFHKNEDGDEAELLAHWLVEYGVTRWEGVSDVNGKELPYSQDTARGVLLNVEYRLSLNQRIFVSAINYETYLHDQAGEDLEALKKF